MAVIPRQVGVTLDKTGEKQLVRKALPEIAALAVPRLLVFFQV